MLLYVYFFMHKGRSQAIYAASEDEARRAFKSMFDVEAGPLVRRENW